MTFNRLGTVPLPLALHLAMHTVIGLFCMFAGGLNMIDPWVKGLQGIGFFALGGFSWGYVFGLLMARKEVVMLGFAASAAYTAGGVWLLGGAWRLLGALLIAVGIHGFVALSAYRKYILEA
jgi:hypothetical protein